LGDRPVKPSAERAATTVEDENHVSGRTFGLEQDHLGSESLECGHRFDLVGPITLRPLAFTQLLPELFAAGSFCRVGKVTGSMTWKILALASSAWTSRAADRQAVPSSWLKSVAQRTRSILMKPSRQSRAIATARNRLDGPGGKISTPSAITGPELDPLSLVNVKGISPSWW
jgi:hypothetical protein